MTQVLGRKKPPGNRAASSLGRIVPTEAKPSELSGEILWSAPEGVKAKSLSLQTIHYRALSEGQIWLGFRRLFAYASLTEEV